VSQLSIKMFRVLLCNIQPNNSLYFLTLSSAVLRGWTEGITMWTHFERSKFVRIYKRIWTICQTFDDRWM